MNIQASIGIFDSGLGGLTVAKRVLERLPGENIVYVGDQAHVPYGERHPDEICGFALGITDFLLRLNAKIIIMACNMSSATALMAANELFSGKPVIGMIEAGARSAVRNTSGGPIGVLATTGTVNTRAYTKTIERLMPRAQVMEQACPRFVPLVESGMCDSTEAEEAAREYVTPLLQAGCRTLILGCTHYPFMLETIQRVAGSGVRIIDPAEETAEEAADILLAMGELSPAQVEASHAFYTTGCPDQLAELGSRFLGSKISDVQQITWEIHLGAIQWQEKTVGQTMKYAP